MTLKRAHGPPQPPRDDHSHYHYKDGQGGYHVFKKTLMHNSEKGPPQPQPLMMMISIKW